MLKIAVFFFSFLFVALSLFALKRGVARREEVIFQRGYKFYVKNKLKF